MSMINIKQLAEKATPGPWQIGTTNANATFINAKYQYIAKCNHNNINNTDPLNPTANAAFIAAADPTTILDLIALLEKAEAALKPFALTGEPDQADKTRVEIISCAADGTKWFVGVADLGDLRRASEAYAAIKATKETL